MIIRLSANAAVGLALAFAMPAALRADVEEARQEAMATVGTLEKIVPPAGLQRPLYLELDRWQALSGAVGTETAHAVPRTWIFEKGIRATLPFEALEAASTDTVKGYYWLYDCFFCSSPENGYVYKIPVIAERRRSGFVLHADSSLPAYEEIKTEALRLLRSAKAKYQKPGPEMKRLEREVPQILGKGLTATPLAAPTRRKTKKS